MKSENIITILVLTISIIYLLNFQESFSEESIFNIKNISTTGATGPQGPPGPPGKGADLPKGVIVAWYGMPNNIPAGWRICDGLAGTPNLKDRFIVGAGGKYRLNTKGGEEKVKLNANQIPAHSHEYMDSFFSEAWGQVKVPGGWGSRAGTDRDNKAFQFKRKTFNTGGNIPHNNMPPYFSLYYIMKL